MPSRSNTTLFLLTALTLVLTLTSTKAQTISSSDGSFTSTSASTHTYQKRALSNARYNELAIVHASLGGVATMLVLPAGVIFARPLRIAMHRWWILHALVNGFFGLGLIVATFAISIVLVAPGSNFTSGSPNSHRLTGLIFFILLVVQVVSGFALKALGKTKVQDPHAKWSVRGHPVQNILHIVLGLGILGLGFWQTWSGFFLIDQTANGLTTPLSIYVLWGVIVGITAWTFLLSLFALPFQIRKEEERREYTSDKAIPADAAGRSNIDSQASVIPNYDSASAPAGGAASPRTPEKNGRFSNFRRKNVHDGGGGGVIGVMNNGTTEPTLVDDSRQSMGTDVRDSADQSRRTSVAPLLENPVRG